MKKKGNDSRKQPGRSDNAGTLLVQRSPSSALAAGDGKTDAGGVETGQLFDKAHNNLDTLHIAMHMKCLPSSFR